MPGERRGRGDRINRQWSERGRKNRVHGRVRVRTRCGRVGTGRRRRWGPTDAAECGAARRPRGHIPVNVIGFRRTERTGDGRDIIIIIVIIIAVVVIVVGVRRYYVKPCKTDPAGHNTSTMIVKRTRPKFNSRDSRVK